MSAFHIKLPQEIEFEKVGFQKKEIERYNQDYDWEDTKNWGVIDFNRYPRSQLKAEIKDFVLLNDYTNLSAKIDGLKQGKFI